MGLIVIYCVAGLVIGIPVGVEIADRGNDEVASALGFLAGALWPLTIAAFLLGLLAVGLVALGRSFAELVRFLRGLRPRRPAALPRATARARRSS